jgi:hypothetical protein
VLLLLARERGVAGLAELDGPAGLFGLMTKRVERFAGLEWAGLAGLREESHREHQHVG